ncbi:polysaccharide deacetylase family protein [Leptospira interrogans]
MELASASEFDFKRLAKVALASPLPYALLTARALRKSPITVLCYHTIRPDNEPIDAWTAVRRSDFVRQMEFLHARYDIVSLDDAFDGGAMPGERPRAVITFDDGEVGLYDSLLPLVAEMRLPVTLYVATGQIEAGRAYWFDDVMNALQADGAFTIDLQAAGLKAWKIGPRRGAARWAAIADILNTLKGVTPAKRAEVAAAVVAQAPRPGSRMFKPLQPMSIAQLQELARNELVTIAAHSHCHSLLDQIPVSQVRESVAYSRALLEEWTGRSVKHFAYPNGNHNKSVEEVVAGLGFRSATALNDRLWRRGMDHFALPRVSIGRYDDFERFKLRLAEI